MPDEVPQAGPLVPPNMSMEATALTLLQEQTSQSVEASQAYANARLHRSPNTKVNEAHFANRVVVGATFYPAHPARMRVLGKGRGKKFKYFVFHRPGKVTDADIARAKGLVNNPLQGKAARGSADPSTQVRVSVQAAKYAEARCRLSGVVRTFRIPNRPASTHFIVGKNGELVQMVDLDDMSYHVKTARHPTLSGKKVTNSNSLGVEITGPVQIQGFRSPFTPSHKQALAKLIRLVSQIYGIPLDRDHFLTHEELAPKIKIDPGPNLNITEILNMANLVPPYTKFYQSPVDIIQADAVAAAKFSLASLGIPSLVFQGIGSDVGALTRSAGIATAGRNDYLQAAGQHASTLAGQLSIMSALLSRQIASWRIITPTPQENRTGLMFDSSTGEWS